MGPHGRSVIMSNKPSNLSRMHRMLKQAGATHPERINFRSTLLAYISVSVPEDAWKAGLTYAAEEMIKERQRNGQ